MHDPVVGSIGDNHGVSIGSLLLASTRSGHEARVSSPTRTIGDHRRLLILSEPIHSPITLRLAVYPPLV